LIRCREPVMSTDVANLLYDNVAHPDALVRTQVINTLVRCHIRPTDAQKGTLGESIDIELLEALHAARCLLDIGDTPACSVLLQTLVNTFERARNNLVRLVALSHQAPDMVIRAARNLVAGNRFERALAVETLSITLNKDHQRLLLALCADSPMDRLLPLFDDRIQIPSLSREQRLECLITGRESTAWLRACAIHAARGTSNEGLLQAIGRYLHDDNKWIRESTAGVLGSRAPAVSPSTSTTTTNSTPGTTIMLNTIEKVSVLKNSSIFADTPTYVLASIGEIADEMLAPAGSTFIVKGVLESSMYVIVSGNARVHDEGKTIAILTAGDVIGEMAVLMGQERSTSVTAVDDMHLLIIEKDAFDEVMANRPEIAHAVIHMLCDRLHKTTLNLVNG
jgi:CRP/FNR family transcriptional regulator, cyclic AMP receptor protein